MDSLLFAGLKGLKWHGHVWPCSLEIVTVPPCLRGALRSTLVLGLGVWLLAVDEQPLTTRPTPTRRARVVLSLILGPFWFLRYGWVREEVLALPRPTGGWSICADDPREWPAGRAPAP